jgi:hypothetical protein
MGEYDGILPLLPGLLRDGRLHQWRGSDYAGCMKGTDAAFGPTLQPSGIIREPA